MATPTWTNLQNTTYDLLACNVTTANPIGDTLFSREINQALRDCWEMSGGSLLTVASATAWTSAEAATGVVNGILTGVAEVIRVWASITSGSVGVSSGDYELDRVELSEIMALRANSAGLPTYLVPKKYAISRLATTTVADVGKLRLDFWPGTAGKYLPTQYMPQFREIDSATITTPDMDDVWAYDAAVLAAERLAPRLDRVDLIPEIAKHYSQKYNEAMQRKLDSQVHAKQGRSAASAAVAG